MSNAVIRSTWMHKHYSVVMSSRSGWRMFRSYAGPRGYTVSGSWPHRSKFEGGSSPISILVKLANIRLEKELR